MRLIKYVFLDIMRNKVLIAYAVFLFAVSFGLFSFSDNPLKAVSSLLNIVLIVLPLFSIIFSTGYYYNAYEFTELILGQPVRRSTLFLNQFLGVGIALCVAFLIGCGLPLLIFLGDTTALLLTMSGVVLTWVFVALAFLSSVYARDKARGIGIALLAWFYFVFLYDSLVLMFLFAFSNYPLENYMMALAFLNPVDLIRVIMLMHLDMAAIMGYTGAVFSKFLGNTIGSILCFSALLIWILLPFLLALRRFIRRDI